MNTPTLQWLIDFFGLGSGVLLAGLAGGLIAMFYEKEHRTWIRSFILLAGSISAALFLTPMITYYGHIPETLEPSIAFVVGLSAKELIRGIINRFGNGGLIQTLLPRLFKKNGNGK